MNTQAPTFSERISEQNTGDKTFTRPNLLRRFRYFIEYSDWDEMILLQEEWLDKMCIGIVIVAALFFAPPVLMMLF